MGNPAPPIEKLLDEIEWRELDQPHVSMADDPGALYATHEGFLLVGDIRLTVYTLNDGQRVFDADSIAAFLSGGGDSQ